MTVFQLARMRHLDLLALWFLLHPDAHHSPDQLRAQAAGRFSKDHLAAILASPRP